MWHQAFLFFIFFPPYGTNNSYGVSLTLHQTIALQDLHGHNFKTGIHKKLLSGTITEALTCCWHWPTQQTFPYGHRFHVHLSRRKSKNGLGSHPEVKACVAEDQ